MAWEVWLAYAVACVVIAVSPGSGAVLSMTHGLAYGVQRTTATILGLQIGLVIVLLIAGVGVGAVLVASATAFTVVKVVGAAYLFWLGFQQWRAPVLVAAAEAGEAAAVVDGDGERRAITLFTQPGGVAGVGLQRLLDVVEHAELTAGQAADGDQHGQRRGHARGRRGDRRARGRHADRELHSWLLPW